MKAILFLSAVLSFNVFAVPTPPSGELLPLSQLYFELYAGGQTRESELKPFGDQTEALGYVPGETFQVPAGLKDRVEFWKKIYSEYTTSQAVFHDSDYPQVIYGAVSLNSVDSPLEVNYKSRRRRVNDVLEDARKRHEGTLRKLAEYSDKSADDVPEELRPLFKKFEDIPGGKDRFTIAIARIRSQIGQRDRISRGFFYGGRYFNQMMEIFEKRHLPKELTRLPLVESAFNPDARSKVGASGIWQFMRSTGKLFMHIDHAVDERNDPLSATVAAADLLQGNYEALGNWSLAMTAYNHGRAGMARAVRETHSTDLVDIIKNYRGPAFGFASSNFYSEFLAILEVEREYRKHFGKLLVDQPLDFDAFPVAHNVRFGNLASACGMDRDSLADLNPGLTNWALSGRGYVPSGYQLRVKAGHFSKCHKGYPKLAKLNLQTKRGRTAKVRTLARNGAKGKKAKARRRRA